MAILYTAARDMDLNTYAGYVLEKKHDTNYRIMSDVWGSADWAIVWDEVSSGPQHILVNVYDMNPDSWRPVQIAVDATDEIREKYKQWLIDVEFNRLLDNATVQSKQIEKGCIAKVVKGKNITYSSASAASNLKFSNYSTLGAAAQLSTGTILAVRQGNVTGSNNQSWAAVSINLSTGVVTTGKVITVTAAEYTGTQQFARNMNLTSFTSDSKKLNIYVLSDPTAKKYKVATWTMPTR